jgi:O-antigen ligase
MKNWAGAAEFREAGTLDKLIICSYVVFLYGFFLFPEAPEHYKFFYFGLLLPALFASPRYFRIAAQSPAYLLIVLFCLYMMASGLWSDPFEVKAYSQALLHGVSVLMFVTVSLALAERYPNLFEVLLMGVCIVGGMVALLSLIAWYAENPFPRSRVKGLGRMHYINRAAAVYAMLGLLCTVYFLRVHDWKKWLFGSLAFVLVSFVVLTKSRTGLIGLSAGLLILVVLARSRIMVYVVLGLVSLVVLSTMVFPEIAQILSRNMPARPYIWDYTMGQIGKAPVLGHGILSDSSIPPMPDVPKMEKGFPHTHSSYLATLRDGGAIGFALLAALLAAIFAAAVRWYKRYGDASGIALLVFVLLVIAPIRDRLITKPREVWLYFWLPIILVAVMELRGRVRTYE